MLYALPQMHTVLVSLLICSTLTTLACAQEGNIILDEPFQRQQLETDLWYLADPEQSMTLKQVLNTARLPWQHGRQRQTYIRPAGVYWIKGSITNPKEHPLSIALEVKPASINAVDLYLINDKREVTQIYNNAGLDTAFTNRPSLHRNIVNTVTLDPLSTATLIWRVSSSPRFEFGATAWIPNYLFDKTQHIQLIHGMLYGALLVMVLYNLFLFLSIHQKSYLYYVLYVASAAYLIAADVGHVYYYIGTGSNWPKFELYTAVYIFNLYMFGRFTTSFLQLPVHSVYFTKGISGLSILAGAMLLATALSSHIAAVSISLISITLLYIAALAAGLLVRRKGIISAGHFVVAILILVFSTIANSMAKLGLIDSNILIDNLPTIGTTLMLIFFSLALADRINQLQKENRDANDAINAANKEKLNAITELERSRLERIKLEYQANQARVESRSKSDFLANLSHEIRTPMNGVMGSTELMKSTPLNQRQHHYLTTIEHSGQTLLSIIDSLQDYAKIESGQMSQDFVSFNLEALLDDCISTFALTATEKNIALMADLDPAIEPVLTGEVTKLQRVILNLLSNAFKFTDTGTITVRVQKTERSAVNRIELRFDIQDSGIGLTEEEQQRLFSPFQHADKSTYGRYGGSGLGLAISKQLVEVLDGQIGVSSTPGQGSCFWFTARLMVEDNADTTLIRKPSSHLVGQHLLLVDSNSITADIIKRRLKNWNIDALKAASVESAKSMLFDAQTKDNPYSIVLCDYQLSDGKALSLAQEIIESEQLSPVCFIIMASNQQLSPQQATAAPGVKLLLEKPVTYDRLHGVLKLAVTAPKEQALEPSEQQTTLTKETIKVLLVEDNPVNQMVLTGLLSALDIHPEIATDGLQALEMIQEQRFDLVFMDCEMPGMDGFEATRRIRAIEHQSQRPAITIIALTAHATPERQQQAKLAGMDDYVIKPVSVSKLRSVIEQLTAA